MNRFLTLIPAAGLAAAVGAWTADAQPPQGDRKGPPPGERDRPPQREGDRRPDGGDRERRPEPRPDAQVEAWVKTLTDRITDPHDAIRDSARAALVAVGRPALPALRKLADAEDGAKAAAARRVMDAIESGPRPPFAGNPPFARRDGDRPQTDRPREDGRRPEADRPREGDRRPETDRPRDGDRRPQGERRPDGPPRGERPDGPPRGERPDAGRGGPPGGPDGSPFARALKEIDLNEKQAKQAGEIRERFEKAMRDAGGPMSEKGRETRDAMMKEMREILGDAKFEKFQELARKYRPMGPGGPGGGPGGRPGGPGERPGRPGGDRDEAPQASAAGAGIPWYTALADGRAEAARTGRPILFLAAAPSCGGVPGIW